MKLTKKEKNLSVIVITQILATIIFAILIFTAEPEPGETKIVEVEVEKKVYVDNFGDPIDDNINSGSFSYWYISYEAGTVTGYDVEKCAGDVFDYAKVYSEIQTTLTKKYEKDFNFIVFKSIVRVDRRAFDYQMKIEK